MSHGHHRLRLDDELFASAERARRAEWELLLAELAAAEQLFPDRTPADIVISCRGDCVRLRFVSGDEVDAVVIHRDDVDAELSEYMAVIGRLEDDEASAMRMEALDMAKRVIHDRGAQRLHQLAPQVSPVHETRRRLFSLLVSLFIDTTGRRMGHGYR